MTYDKLSQRSQQADLRRRVVRAIAMHADQPRASKALSSLRHLKRINTDSSDAKYWRLLRDLARGLNIDIRAIEAALSRVPSRTGGGNA